MGVLVRVLVLVVMIAAVFGGAAYFAYDLFWKPKKLVEVEKREAEEAAKLPPPPHPSIAALDEARLAVTAGRTDEAREMLEKILAMPDAPVGDEARDILGGLNAARLFSPGDGPDKTPYTVVRGDALAKIAGRTGAGAELIYRVNNLQTINLQIGQILMIPSIQIASEVDREKGILTLFNQGRFFKSYKLLGATVPGLAAGGTLEAKVSDKIATKDGKRVAFGEKGFAEAERMVLLAPGGASLRAMPPDAESPPPGIVLAPADLEEVFVLVSRGTPFTIR